MLIHSLVGICNMGFPCGATSFHKQSVKRDLALAQQTIAPKDDDQDEQNRENDSTYAIKLGRIFDASQRLGQAHNLDSAHDRPTD
jgi:hypothetical protein